MPELPEVETLKRELARALVGWRFQTVKILWPKAVAPFSPARLARELKNREIESVERRAKILFLNLDNGAALAIHLKMTGQLIYIGGHPQLNPFKYTRAIFKFENGAKLYFNDLRKFGWLRLLPPQDKSALAAKHGLEPLDPEFTLANFTKSLERYPKRKLKLTLLDQTFIAGLGNIYADESCFAAGLRPARRVKGLTATEVKKLYLAIKRILRLAIKHGGTSARDYVRSDGQPGGFAAYLKVYGRGGEPCHRCRRPITKIKLAGRGTHYCPKCQH